MKKIICLNILLFTYNTFAITYEDIKNNTGDSSARNSSNNYYNNSDASYSEKLNNRLDSYPKFNQEFAIENPYDRSGYNSQQSQSNSNDKPKYPEFDKKNSVENPYDRSGYNSQQSQNNSNDKPKYPEFDKRNSVENPYEKKGNETFNSKFNFTADNENSEKYNRILVIYMTGSDGNPNGLSHDINYEKEYFENNKGLSTKYFLEIVKKPRLVNGTDLRTGAHVSVVQDSEYVFPKTARPEILPQSGVIFAAVPINQIRDGIYDNGINYLLDWVSDARHVGKIRIVGHGSSRGTVGMDVYGYREPRISIKHLVVARWLINGGLIKNKYDRFHQNQGKLAQYGLRTIHVASCLAGSYTPQAYTNVAGTGTLNRNKMYHHKLNNVDTFNLQPDYGNREPLPPWAYQVNAIDYGSGIAQYEGVFKEEFHIHGINITGSMDSILVGFDGKYYRTVDDGTPEQIFINRTFHEAYDDYKRRAAPYENSGYSAGSQYLHLKERRYRFEQRIINGRKETIILSKSIREGYSDSFKQEPVTEEFEINFVKTKIPAGLTSGTIIVPPTNYCLMIVGDGSGYSHVTLSELLTKSPNKIRVIT